MSQLTPAEQVLIISFVFIMFVFLACIFTVAYTSIMPRKLSEHELIKKSIMEQINEPRYTPVTKSNYRRVNKVSDMDNTTLLAAAMMMSGSDTCDHSSSSSSSSSSCDSSSSSSSSCD